MYGDNLAVRYSNSLYPLVNLPDWSAGDGEGAFTNSPFMDAIPPPSTEPVKARIVSFGIRLRYTGTELNRSGSIVTVEEPNHISLNGRSVADLLLLDRTTQQQVDREWHTALYQPTALATEKSGEVQFTNGYPAGNEFLAVTITGVPGETFDWEYVINNEYIGSPARAKTLTPVDPTWVAYIQAAFASMTTDQLLTAGKSAASAYKTFSEVHHRLAVEL